MLKVIKCPSCKTKATHEIEVGDKMVFCNACDSPISVTVKKSKGVLNETYS